MTLRQRHPRREYPKHLAWLRTLPSIIRGEGRIEAAHIRFGDIAYGKRQTGMGERPDDCWCLPLAAHVHHYEQHKMNERAFWLQHEIDPILIAALLFCHSGDDHAGTTVIRNAKVLSL